MVRCPARLLELEREAIGEAKEVMIYNCDSYIGKLKPRPQCQGWIPTVRVCGYSCKLELGGYVMSVLIEAITHVLGIKGGPQGRTGAWGNREDG